MSEGCTVLPAGEALLMTTLPVATFWVNWGAQVQLCSMVALTALEIADGIARLV